MHSFSDLLVHTVFSTKERARYLDAAIRADAHAYLGGIVRELKASALIVGGTEDHVHMLLRLPSDLAVADCLRVVKTHSSRWIHERWPDRGKFAWQTGYAAFSVSESNRDAVVRYIREQQRHHRKMSFQDELRALLRKHGIGFDERYIWK